MNQFKGLSPIGMGTTLCSAIAFYIVFYGLFGPAFWHTFNKRILID